MNVRKLRLQRGWSQEELAEMTGLSIRTIQRIERGQTPALESRKALAAVFDIDISQWQPEDSEMSNTPETTATDQQEQQALEYVRDLKAFYTNVLTYLVVIPFLFFINLTTSPGYLWAWWPTFGWGIGLLIHGIQTFEVFNFFGPGWEKKQVEKRLGRKL
ncbi:2TM domain-containing protein [Gilvimarinus sp. DA14]|uniref:2TM domain-containing protein n=1 Tax=Gilvimarinus sp. DA14 TaxID=2956798 RepID=UPI0020B83BBB|nr:2TM domain-containing protein [Gilvimarinus sp. DA14]UTF59061.1 2TM domain-containing protein [Gilvimarinus sp. DA14]